MTAAVFKNALMWTKSSQTESTGCLSNSRNYHYIMRLAGGGQGGGTGVEGGIKVAT